MRAGWIRSIVIATIASASSSVAAMAQTDASTATETAQGTDDVAPIIVTARLRNENLQQVPIAVTVVGGEALDRAYTVNTQGLTTQVASLNYSSANPRNTAFTIRGQGSSVVAVSQSNDGLEPGVGFYIDGVYHARPATAAFDFSDIDHIEVLRGPQGTLFGKNTTAGAISITSRMPSFTPEATEELSLGERRYVQVRASGTGGLVDDLLAFRVSGIVTRRDGVLFNVAKDHDQNTLGNQAVRGQLLFTPTPDLRFRLIADFTNFQSECCTQVFLRVGTSLRSPTRQFGGPTGLAAQFGYAPPSTNPYDRLTDIDAPVNADTNEGGVALNSDWNLGPATLTSISAWRFWNWDAANDRDYTGIPIQLIQHIPSRQDQFSQELRLASNGDRRLSYVAGLYYFHQNLEGHPESIYGSAAARYLIGTSVPTSATNPTPVPVPANLLDGYGTTGYTDFKSSSYAAFGEVNFRVVPRVTVTGGLRYTYEHKTGFYDSPVFGGPAIIGTPAQITTLTNARLGILRRQTYSARDNDGSLSGRANIAWQATDDLLGYFSYARGFKSGGINMSGLPLTSANQPALTTAVIKPERNVTYEIGLKAQALDKRVTVNLAGYYTKVRNFQATVVDSSQTVALRGYLSNVPEETIKGIEADVTLRPLRGLTVGGTFAYTHGVYTDYPRGPCPLEAQTAATTICSLTGQRLVGLPRYAGTINAEYALPIDRAAADLILRVDSSWRSSYFGDPSLSKYTRIDGYNLTNASLGFRSRAYNDRGGWEIAVFARNLFDSDYIQNLTIQAGNSGLILGTPSDPRTIGVTFRARQ